MAASQALVPVTDGARLLAGLEQARALLAEARSVDEVKQLRDQAEAMRVYARQAQLGLESQNYAAEIKLRAERRAGELLVEMERWRPEMGRPPAAEASQAATHTPSPPTLSDLGITRTQAHRWEAVAAIPEPVFEQHIAETKARGQELTGADVQRLARESRPLSKAPVRAPAEEYVEPKTQATIVEGTATCPVCGTAIPLAIQVVPGLTEGTFNAYWFEADHLGKDWFDEEEPR